MIKCSVCGESLNGQTKCPVCGTVNYNVGQDKPKVKETNNNVGYVDPVQAKLDVIENFKKSVAKVNVEILGRGYVHGTGWCGYDNTIITNAHVVFSRVGHLPANTLEEVLEADRLAREAARAFLNA